MRKVILNSIVLILIFFVPLSRSLNRSAKCQQFVNSTTDVAIYSGGFCYVPSLSCYETREKCKGLIFESCYETEEPFFECYSSSIAIEVDW